MCPGRDDNLLNPSRPDQEGFLVAFDFQDEPEAIPEATASTKNEQTPASAIADPQVLAAFEAPAPAGHEPPRRRPFDGMLAIEAFEEERICPSPELAERILEATRELSLLQALNPSEKDKTGFSNADFKIGSILAAVGATRSSALLLLQYPRQSSNHGLEREDLSWALPEAPEGMPARASAMRSLGVVRDESRNSVAWVEKADSVVLVGYSLEWDDKRLLRNAGVETPHGYEINKSRLGLVLDRIKGRVTNLEGLKEIARNAPPLAADAPGLAPGMKPVEFSVVRAGRDYAVGYSDPFSPEGLKVKDAIKMLGGTWDRPQPKMWGLKEEGMKMLPLLVESIPRVDITALPYKGDGLEPQLLRKAELLRDGVTPIQAEKFGPSVYVSTLSRCEALYEACRSTSGIKWDGDRRAYKVEPEAMGALLEKLDPIETVDITDVLGLAQDVLAAKQAELQALEEIASGGLEISKHTPSGKEMFEHQMGAVEFVRKALRMAPGCILADDMGLGKTCSALVAAHLEYPGDRKLILCPASLKLNWAREINLFLGDKERLHTQVIKDGKDEIEPGMRWVICTYDMAKKMTPELQKWGPRVAIEDEAHALKNFDSQRSKVLVGYDTKDEKGRWKKVSGLTDGIEKNIVLTGTEIKNRMKELFNMLRIIKHPLGNDYFRFGVRFCDGHKEEINRAGDTRWNFEGVSNLEDLSREIKPVYLKRFKDEVLNLPPQIESRFPIELTPGEMRAYKQGHAALLALHRGEGHLVDQEKKAEGPGSVLAQFTALQQATAIAKIPAAIEYVRNAIESGEKVIYFSNYYAPLDAMEAEFGGISVRLDGSLNDKQRQAAIDRFQNDPSCRLFIGSLQACKEGMTLTAGRLTVFNDQAVVPADHMQARDRNYRIGTTGTVNVVNLVAEGTFDEELTDLVGGKIRTIKAFNKALKDGEPVDYQALAAANADVRLELIRSLASAGPIEEGKAGGRKKAKAAVAV